MTKLLALAAVAVLALAACRPAQPGWGMAALRGRTATEQFSVPSVARLADAACQGDMGGVRRALRDGADPNFVGRDWLTPLHWAVACESERGVAELLRAGADPNFRAEDAEGLRSGFAFSPTYLAAGSVNEKILPLLLQDGGSPDAYLSDNPALSALLEALRLGLAGGRWENWRTLLAAGADIEQHNALGDSLIVHAFDMAGFDQVIELLDRGYSYRLDLLAWAVQNDYDNNSPHFDDRLAKRDRIKRMLEERGVQFPVRPPWEQRQSEEDREP